MNTSNKKESMTSPLFSDITRCRLLLFLKFLDNLLVPLPFEDGSDRRSRNGGK